MAANNGPVTPAGGGSSMVLLIYIIIIVVAFFIIKAIVKRVKTKNENALMLLKQKFEAGEISETEYNLEKQKILNKL